MSVSVILKPNTNSIYIPSVDWASLVYFGNSLKISLQWPPHTVYFQVTIGPTKPRDESLARKYYVACTSEVLEIPAHDPVAIDVLELMSELDECSI